MRLNTSLHVNVNVACERVSHSCYGTMSDMGQGVRVEKRETNDKPRESVTSSIM